MKHRMFVCALAFGLAGAAGALFGATPADFDLEILPAESSISRYGEAVDQEIVLTTRIDETQGWSLGVLLDPDAGVTAEITSLRFGDEIQTLKEGDPAEFQALNYYAASDLTTPLGACEPQCWSISAGAFNMGVTIQILQQITMPARPDGVVIAEFTVQASAPEQEPPPQLRVPFSDEVGDPTITTVAVHGGLSFAPGVQNGATITLDGWCVPPSPFTMEIESGGGSWGATVDSTVTLNFNADGSQEGNEVDGWSYGICVQDPSKLGVVDATIEGTDTATARCGDPPDFNMISILPAGVTHAVTIVLVEVPSYLEAQNDFTDLVVTYEVMMDTEGDSVFVTPCDSTLGDPPVKNIMSVEGVLIALSAFEGTDPGDGCCDPAICNLPGEFGMVPVDRFIPGSANGDGVLDLADPIYTLNWLFRDGPPPPCQKAADADGDCVIDASDAVYMVEYMFLNGPVPVLGLGCQLVGAAVCPNLTCEFSECTP